MCQEQCLAILTKEKKWMTAKQIKEQIEEIGIGSTRNNLLKLRRREIIKSRIKNKIKKSKEYEYKIR